MKRILYLILVATSLFVVVSCESFLTEVSKNSLTPENSFTDEASWDKALSSAYAMLQLVFVEKYTITLNEFGTDEVEPYDLSWAAYSELKNYSFSAQHEFLRCHYIWNYDGIKRCNTVIDMPEYAPVSEHDRTLMIAQARFLRAIYYFELVSYYGGVPLWTSAYVDKNQISKPRASADAVYELITEDMTFAASKLPSSWSDPKDKGRATSHAANALLGRFYLQWGKPDLALVALNKVQGFSLYEDYEDIFDPKNKNQEKENIFEVQFRHSGSWGLEGSIQSSYWGPRGGGGPTAGGFSWGGFGPTRYLYDSYENNDKRKDAFFCTNYKGVPQDPPCIMKYRDPEYGELIEDDNLNYIMMRWPDVLLMKAEALNAIDDKTNAKYECINTVRRRAGVKEYSEKDGLTKEDFADKVLNERLLELCCEHHRRTDLVRFGKLAEQVKKATENTPSGAIILKEHHNLYPIPQQAIDSNDAMLDSDQNPGY